MRLRAQTSGRIKEFILVGDTEKNLGEKVSHGAQLGRSVDIARTFR